MFGWSSAVPRLLATLQCESTEHMRARWNARIEGKSVLQGERTFLIDSFRPQIARRFQFRHPFVAQMSRFCAIRGTRAYFHLICCSLDRSQKKRTCCGPRSNKCMAKLESLGDLRPKRLFSTCSFALEHRTYAITSNFAVREY